jgi:hypothetical protein
MQKFWLFMARLCALFTIMLLLYIVGDVIAQG